MKRHKHRHNRHALLAARSFLRHKRLKAKSKSNNEYKNARKVEKKLVHGVNKVMRQGRANRLELFNNWKTFYDNHGRPIVLI